MTPETARILAQALRQRDAAADGLRNLLRTADKWVEIPPAIASSMRTLASSYVHEQRIINHHQPHHHGGCRRVARPLIGMERKLWYENHPHITKFIAHVVGIIQAVMRKFGWRG